MKNIIVIATACRASGALSIYNQFLTNLKYWDADNHYYIFIHPSMHKYQIDNVEYICYDTHRYIDRIIFDWIKCKKIIQDKGVVADVVVSLQNTGLRCFRGCRTVIYYHQSIPFYPNKWNPFNKDERLLFYYKHIYPLFVQASLSKQTDVIVQIPFIKRSFIKYFNFPCEKIHVLFPDIEVIDIDDIPSFDFNDDKCHFIYPATYYSYKNHITIIEALCIIRDTNPALLSNLVVHFTIDKDNCYSIKNKVINEHLEGVVSFDGQIPHEILLSMYKSSKALLFPSEIETLGLPLVEAAQFGINIIVSDMDYAREVLTSYNGQQYIHPNNYAGWAKAIEKVCSIKNEIKPLKHNKETSWKTFFQIINN